MCRGAVVIHPFGRVFVQPWELVVGGWELTCGRAAALHRARFVPPSCRRAAAIQPFGRVFVQPWELVVGGWELTCASAAPSTRARFVLSSCRRDSTVSPGKWNSGTAGQ